MVNNHYNAKFLSKCAHLCLQKKSKSKCQCVTQNDWLIENLPKDILTWPLMVCFQILHEHLGNILRQIIFKSFHFLNLPVWKIRWMRKKMSHDTIFSTSTLKQQLSWNFPIRPEYYKTFLGWTKFDEIYKKSPVKLTSAFIYICFYYFCFVLKYTWKKQWKMSLKFRFLFC